MARCMLTTVDNPYNPFTQFRDWLNYDNNKQHHTCELLGRIARTSEQSTDEENDEARERAIDEIIKYDFQNLYKKVVEKDSPRGS